MQRIVFTVFSTLCLSAISTIATGQGNNVYACVNNTTQIPRIVAVGAQPAGWPSQCIASPQSKAETARVWAVQGPIGPAGPQGATGVPGAVGQQGLPGPQGPAGPAATNAAPPCFDNANRYVNCGNGTVTDTLTGLIWLRDATCFPNMDYASSGLAVSTLSNGQCGLTDGSSAGDWRLPSKAEWQATIAHALSMACNNPTLGDDAGLACFSNNGTASSFVVAPGVAGYFYWTSTSFESGTGAWVVLLDDGTFDSKGKLNAGFIVPWPVRGARR
jgi:hypothetical protein